MVCLIIISLFVWTNNFVNYSEAWILEEIILEGCLAKGHPQYNLF